MSSPAFHSLIFRSGGRKLECRAEKIVTKHLQCIGEVHVPGLISSFILNGGSLFSLGDDLHSDRSLSKKGGFLLRNEKVTEIM